MKGAAAQACVPNRHHTALAVALSLSSLFWATASASPPVAPGHVLSIRLEGDGRGRVTVEPRLERYPPGTVVTLTAVASGTNVFRGWSGPVPHPRRMSVSLSIERDTEIVATFMASRLDPIPARIQPGTIVAGIEEFARIPASLDRVPDAPADPAQRSRGYYPAARINALKPLNDGTGRLVVSDQRGLLYLVSARGEVTPFLDLGALRPDFVDWPGLTAGLNAVAIAPDFATSGRFYTVHTERPASRRGVFRPMPGQVPVAHFVLTAWTAEAPSANRFSGSSREVLRLEAPEFQHGLQDIGFDPNLRSGEPGFGMLYVLVGDGTSVWQGFPGNIDRPDSIFGTVLRIDPDGRDAPGGGYGIPPDNPRAAPASGREFREIWASGFRNPHKMSWDRGGTRSMLVSDVGESNLEEVNVVLPGRRYGWPHREGTWVTDPLGDLGQPTPPVVPDDRPYLMYPVVQFDHDEGSAVSGGFVYRGAVLPELAGVYVFGDLGRGRVLLARASEFVPGKPAAITELQLQSRGKRTTLAELVGSPRVDLHLGADAAGEIYLLSKTDGVIRRLVRSK